MATDYSMMDKHGIPSIRLQPGPAPPTNKGVAVINSSAPMQPPTRPFQRFISAQTTVYQRNLSGGSAGSNSHHSHASGSNDELLDDSLTNLNWLQGVKLGVMPGSTPPTSPRNGVMLKQGGPVGPPATVSGGIVAIQHSHYPPSFVGRPHGSANHLMAKHQQPQMFIANPTEEHHHMLHQQQITGGEWATQIDTNANYFNTAQPGHITLPPICTVMEPAVTQASSLDNLISGAASAQHKPTYSYSQLIYFALTSSPEKAQMTLQEIFDWIMNNFPYYRTADPSWQSSVRHNLSLNRCFERVSRKRSGPDACVMQHQKTSLWQLSRNYASFLLDNGASDVADEGELSPRRRFGGDTLEEPSKRLKVSGDLTDLFGPELINDILSAESALFSDLAPDGERHPALLGAPPAFTVPPLNMNTARPNVGNTAATPPSENDTSDSFEELLLQDMVNEMNGQAPVDLLTGEALDLTVTGVSLRPPPDWWAPEVAEMLMGPSNAPSSQNLQPGGNSNNNNSAAIDPLVNSLTASFFVSDGSIWANADWDPEALDNFQPPPPSSNK